MGYTTTVQDYKGVSVNEDGTRTLDLDVIFEGQITSYPETVIDGLPAKTFYAQFNSPVKLVDDKGRYFTPGGWDADHYHRQGYMGEMVQGPQMFGTLHSSVISAHSDPQRDTAIEVNEGDIVLFLGGKFRASSKNWEKRMKFERI